MDATRRYTPKPTPTPSNIVTRNTKLNELESVLDPFDYPVSRQTVVDDCADVTIQLADGEANMSEVVAQSSADAFDSPEELRNELMSLLPRNAVGEPYQSEGEG